MTTSSKLSSLTLALAAVFCMAGAHAAMPKNVYDGAKADIKASYKAAEDKCDAKTDNAKDVCKVEVKGQEKVALAHLEYQYSGSEKDRLKLHEAAYEARYDVAKEKCDDKTGEAKDLCQREAKTLRDKAKASKKLDEKVTEAFSDADMSMRKADYKLAKEKCESQTGGAKDICEASVKARYPDM